MKKELKKELCYSEQLEMLGRDWKLSRQKDTIDGEWYGIYLEYKGKDGETEYADSEEWIFGRLYPALLNKKWRYAAESLEIVQDKEGLKSLRYLLKKAVILGWIDYLTVKPNENDK